MATKVHWTQTPEGRKKMSEAQLRSSARRKAQAAGGAPSMVGSAILSTSRKPPRIPWNKGKHTGTGRKHTAAQRKAISDGLKRRQARLAQEAAANGHTNGDAPLSKYASKTIVKAEMRRYAIIGMKHELADLERRRQMLIMAIGRE